MTRPRYGDYARRSSRSARRSATCAGDSEAITATDVDKRIAAMTALELDALMAEVDAVSSLLVMRIPSTEGAGPVNDLDERRTWDELHPEARYRGPGPVMMSVAVLALAAVDLLATAIEAVGRRWHR